MTSGLPTPYSVHVFDEVTSTQDVARSLFRNRPLVVVASRQSEGRGRSGRGWVSAPRALAVSAAFDIESSFPGWPVGARSLIPLATGVAAATILDSRVGLKWPNDLLIGERKVGGILVEAVGSRMVIGCGLNLWWPNPPLDRAALFDQDPGPQIGLAVKLAEALWPRLAAGPSAWGGEEYRKRSQTIGSHITWNGDRRGRAIDIDPSDGSLLVESDTAGLIRLNAGEVQHVRSV